MNNIDHIREVNARHQARILSIPGVTAMGVGFLSGADGSLTEEVGILIYIQKVGIGAKSIPSTIEGFKVDVRFGVFRSPSADALHQDEFNCPPADVPKARGVEDDNPRNRLIEPMIGGIGANPDFFYVSPTVGTIGLVVKNKAGGASILSNRHVIAGKKPKVGDPVSQPARNVTGDKAASLVNWQLGDITYQGKRYGVDAATATPTNGRSATIGKMFELNDLTGAGEPTLGLKVTKSGITTGITIGKITAIDLATSNDVGTEMSNQVVIRAVNHPGDFSAPGDSGSAIVALTTNDTENVVALLWGGNEDHETVASPIVPILDHFECTVV